VCHAVRKRAAYLRGIYGGEGFVGWGMDLREELRVVVGENERIESVLD